MNKKLIIFIVFFISINAGISLLNLLKNLSGDVTPFFTWIISLIILYVLRFISKENSKLNWLLYGSFAYYLYYCMTSSTLKFLSYENTSLIFFINHINNAVFLYFKHLSDYLTFSTITLFPWFNIFALIIIICSLSWTVIFNNKYINQIISENLLLAIIISLLICLFVPVYKDANIDPLKVKINKEFTLSLFSIISVNMTLLVYFALVVLSRSKIVGICLIVFTLIYFFSQITLNNASFTSLSLGFIIPLIVYLCGVKVKIHNYIKAIKFYN